MCLIAGEDSVGELGVAVDVLHAINFFQFVPSFKNDESTGSLEYSRVLHCFPYQFRRLLIPFTLKLVRYPAREKIFEIWPEKITPEELIDELEKTAVFKERARNGNPVSDEDSQKGSKEIKEN